jgi:hypothetical protein
VVRVFLAFNSAVPPAPHDVFVQLFAWLRLQTGGKGVKTLKIAQYSPTVCPVE